MQGCASSLCLQGTAPSADVTITYSSEKVFNDMIAGTLSPAKAVLMGKLKVLVCLRFLKINAALSVAA